MTLGERQLQPELLDELPATAPEAIHSRGDLRRVNWLMGNAGWLARLARRLKLSTPGSLTELACGDGQLLVRLLEQLDWCPRKITLVDRQPVVAADTLERLKARGGEVAVVADDVFQWLAADSTPKTDIIVTNLFLHHFTTEPLQKLLRLVAAKTDALLACEPRRCPLALNSTRLLGLIGCNHVTRHDAEISVRAGFKGDDLSRFWPDRSAWNICEQKAGLFSHTFGAKRATSSPAST